MFHPLISKWFSERFSTPTEAQRLGWPSILERRDTLIAAPTGSGKALAAFLAGLDALVIVSAADPMNLVGIVTPGAKVPATAANAVAYLGGRCVGHRIAGEVWVEAKLDLEIARKVKRALKVGEPRVVDRF